MVHICISTGNQRQDRKLHSSNHFTEYLKLKFSCLQVARVTFFFRNLSTSYFPFKAGKQNCRLITLQLNPWPPENPRLTFPPMIVSHPFFNCAHSLSAIPMRWVDRSGGHCHSSGMTGAREREWHHATSKASADVSVLSHSRALWRRHPPLNQWHFTDGANLSVFVKRPFILAQAHIVFAFQELAYWSRQSRWSVEAIFFPLFFGLKWTPLVYWSLSVSGEVRFNPAVWVVWVTGVTACWYAEWRKGFYSKPFSLYSNPAMQCFPDFMWNAELCEWKSSWTS